MCRTQQQSSSSCNTSGFRAPHSAARRAPASESHVSRRGKLAACSASDGRPHAARKARERCDATTGSATQSEWNERHENATKRTCGCTRGEEHKRWTKLTLLTWGIKIYQTQYTRKNQNKIKNTIRWGKNTAEAQLRVIKHAHILRTSGNHTSIQFKHKLAGTRQLPTTLQYNRVEYIT